MSQKIQNLGMEFPPVMEEEEEEEEGMIESVWMTLPGFTVLWHELIKCQA